MGRTPGTFLLALLLVSAAANGDDRRANPRVLTIMTFNAEFLWDGIPPEDGKARVVFPWKGDRAKALAHMRDVAEVIRRHDPDVVNLCEIENHAALALFNRTFFPDSGYAALLIDGEDTETGQDMGLLTRIDPEAGSLTRTNESGQSGATYKRVSKNLIYILPVGDLRLGFVGVHLLAQPDNTMRRADREAQADAVRNAALKLRRKGCLPIVLGDLNDYDDAPEALDREGSRPVTRVLRILREMEPDTPTDDLFNAAEFVPRRERYTALWDRGVEGVRDPGDTFTMIDHVLLSPELRPFVTSVRIAHDHDPYRVSDHFPVIVTLSFQDQAMPAAPPTQPVFTLRIVELLPAPREKESLNERVTLRNGGSVPVELRRWTLRDLTGRTWALDAAGVLPPGQSVVVRREGRPMALNNTGDTIELVDPSGRVVHSVTYGNVAPDQVVRPR